MTKQAASASQMGRFETKFLATDDIAALADLSGLWIDGVHDCHPPKTVVLDLDSSVSPTYGDQEGTAYNGHFGCTCDHPLFLFNQFGDLKRCSLRPGNVHSAHGWHNSSWFRSSNATRSGRFGFIFAATQPSAHRTSMNEAEGLLYEIPPARQQGSPRDHRPPSNSPRRSPAQPFIGQLQLSGRIVGQQAPRGRQGRVASGRALPPRRFPS